MVLPDHMIASLNFISPMAPGVKIPGVISYGLTSYGYDARVSPKNLKVFSEINAKEINPKNFDPKCLVSPTIYTEGQDQYFYIPPHGFALCETVEEFNIPREYLCLVVGKSTYARCFSGDTKVKLVDGTSPSLKEMSDQYLLSNKSFYGFGFDINKNKYIAQKLIAPRKIGKEKVMIVTLDNNQQIKCTPDHLFYLRSGKTKRADQLIDGDSLLPLYTSVAKGYERVWDPFNRKFLPVSRMVDSMLTRNGKLKPRKKDDHIHHKDRNKRNNNPKNIERISAIEHTKLHNKEKDLSQQSKNYWSNAENKINHLKILHTSEVFKKAGASRKKFYSTEEGKEVSKKARDKMWQSRGKEGRSRQAEVIRNLNLRSDITEETLTQALLESGTIRGASKILKVDRSAFRRFPNIIKAFKEKKLQNNHSVIIVSNVSQKEEDVYCLTATETGNFALDAGVIVQNCGLIVNVTPGEPEWIGKWTVELSNTTNLPIRVFLNEGIMQCIFLKGEQTCRTSYADKKGKYQNQSGMTLPKVVNSDGIDHKSVEERIDRILQNAIDSGNSQLVDALNPFAAKRQPHEVTIPAFTDEPIIELSKGQKELLKYIISFIKTRGKPPTYQEMSVGSNLSIATIRNKLVVIENKKYIKIEKNVHRGITVLKTPEGKDYVQNS